MKNELIAAGVVIVLIIILFSCVTNRIKKKKERIKKRNNVFQEANQSNTIKNKQDNNRSDSLEEDNVMLKIQMYIISLWLLFVLVIPITLDLKRVNGDSWSSKLRLICGNNILPIVCLAMAVLGMVLYKQLKYRWNGTRDLSVKVETVESENFEYLTFLTTYIIPLVCINLDETRYVVVLFVLLLIIGVIFIKSDFYLGNPSLALMNYKLYRIQFSVNGEKRERLVISREKIIQGDFIEAIPFDDKTWFVKRSEEK